MTLQERNSFFKVCVGITIFSMVCLIIASVWLFYEGPGIFEKLQGQAVQRGLAAPVHFGMRWSYAPFLSMVFSVLYALCGSFFIYYYFEKTQVLEILFFAFFVLSFAFEPCRMMVPLIIAADAPNVYLFLSSRLLLVGRYLGLFSIFIASVYASGLKIQQQRNNILVLIGVSILFAFKSPLDSLSFTSALNLSMGYAKLFALAEALIVLLSVLSFFVSAQARGNKDFIIVGLGALAVCVGRSLLINADTVADPFIGLALLCCGTAYICVPLHRVYMWL